MSGAVELPYRDFETALRFVKGNENVSREDNMKFYLSISRKRRCSTFAPLTLNINSQVSFLFFFLCFFPCEKYEVSVYITLHVKFRNFRGGVNNVPRRLVNRFSYFSCPVTSATGSFAYYYFKLLLS